MYKHRNIAKFLLEKGAKFNINKAVGFDEDRVFPFGPDDSLAAVIQNNDYDMLELIIEKGYSLNDNTSWSTSERKNISMHNGYVIYLSFRKIAQDTANKISMMLQTSKNKETSLKV